MSFSFFQKKQKKNKKNKNRRNKNKNKNKKVEEEIMEHIENQQQVVFTIMIMITIQLINPFGPRVQKIKKPQFNFKWTCIR